MSRRLLEMERRKGWEIVLLDTITMLPSSLLSPYSDCFESKETNPHRESSSSPVSAETALESVSRTIFLYFFWEVRIQTWSRLTKTSLLLLQFILVDNASPNV